MVKMFPDVTKTRVIFSSGAEEQFYNSLRDQLGDGWRVYHSCTLSVAEAGEGMRDNEMDFLLYHPNFGILVVEVKGGRIRCQDGKFFSVNRFDESFEINNPFQQALVWKSRFLRYLKMQKIRVPVSHAVCMPAVAEDEFPETAGVEKKLIIGRSRLKDLDRTLRSIVELSQPEQFLRFDDVSRELDDLLIGRRFQSRLFLRDYIDSHESKVKDVESIHETLITPISGAQRLAIEGEAGTGKTMLALLLARHFRDQGKRVLLVTSNGLLNLFLQREAGPGIDVSTYNELSNSFGVSVSSVPEDFKGKHEDWLQYEGPERLKAAVIGSARRYDVLLSDEAQDVQPFWWEALEALLPADGTGRFYLFFDRSQGIFGSGGGQRLFVPEDVLPVKPPYFPLVHNYRTTREIATFSRAFRTGTQILQSHSGRIGYLPEIFTYTDAEDARRQLGKLVRKLIREEGLTSDEMTILSARNPDAKESVLFQTPDLAKYPLHKLSHDKKTSWRDAGAPRGSIGVSTVHGFKGLETKIGILVNFSEYQMPLENPIMSSLVYVACTRAKHMLYIFVQKEDPKRIAFEKALSEIKTSGALVLEAGASSDFEFVGTVAHYNPERVGWLSVDDPAFTKGSVMFFPHDVKSASLNELKVGQKLRFRTRVEGQATIASDLQILKTAQAVAVVEANVQVVSSVTTEPAAVVKRAGPIITRKRASKRAS